MFFKRFRRQPETRSEHEADEQPAPIDASLINLLLARNGQTTTVVVRDGRRYTICNIVYGYDSGDEGAHIITNLDSDVPGQKTEFFTTDNVVAVLDEEGVDLYP